MKHYSCSRWLVVIGLLFMCAVVPDVWAQVPLSTINAPYSQDFNTLANTGTSSTVPPGFAFVESGTSANTTYAAGTGSGNTGDTYSFGATSATDRAFGSQRSGSVVPTIGASFVNNTSTTITSLSITYTGEQWRLGTAGRVDRLDFQYSLDASSLTTGTYIDVDALDFTAPITTIPLGALDGNVPANRTAITSTISGLSIAPGATFWIRLNDADATNADDGLAIDDFSLTPLGVAPCAQTVTNTNTGATFCTIQAAIDAPTTLSGHTIQVASGTYNEQVSIAKSLTIIGVGATKPILNFTGTPALANGHPTIFDITTANVRIENLDFEVDLTKLNSAVLASAANISNLAVVSNTINPYRSGTVTSSFGNRNAISINYGGPTNYRFNSSNSSGLLIQGNTVSYKNNGTPADASDDAGFRAGVATDEGGGSFTGNTIQATSADILVRFALNGAVSVTNNNFNGFGLELAEFNAGAASLMVTGNTFDGTFGSAFTSSLRLKNNTNSIPTTVANNTFTGHNLGINLENYQAVTVDNNTFTPAANSTTYRHIVENTKEGSSSSGTFTPMVSLTLTRNTFNGSGATGGIGLGFYNQDNDSPVFGTFTLGTPGNENNFTSGLGTFIYLDNTTGTANPNATPVAPWATNLNAVNNRFDAGNGLKPTNALTVAERATLETKLFHKPDDAQLGLITYYFPVLNVTQNQGYPTIQSAVDAANAGDVLSAADGTYDELVTINKALTIQGTGANSNVTFTGTVPGSTLASLFTVAASDVTIQNLGFTVDLSKTHSAIHTTGDNRTNLQITGNTITPTGTPAGSYGRRNAIAINPNISGIPGYTQDSDGFAGVIVKGNTVNISAGGILSSFRAAVQMDLCGGTIGGSTLAEGNTFTSINHDVNVRFSNQGPVTIQNNTSLGGGIQFAEPNPGAGLITIANNTLTGATVQPATGQLGTGALMRIQNNTAGTTVSIANNGFTNYRWAMSVENFNTVTLSGNTFTPLANSTDYRSISFNTKLLATTPSASVPPVQVGATLTNNTFNGSGAAGGTGIAFFNHRQDGASPSIGNYVLGTTGNENTFNAGIATFLRLDNSTGPSSGFTSPFGEYTVSGAPSTTMNYWTPDLNAVNNKFDVGSGAKLPAALTGPERMTLDGQLFDKNDDANVGRILYFFPVRNLTQNTNFSTIQSAVDAANAGDVLSAAAGTYPEEVTVTKSLTILGANAGVTGFGTRAAESVIDGAGTRTGLVVAANNVVVDGFKFIAGQGAYGAGVAFNGQQTGGQILNNIFSDNVIGVVEPTANAVIRRNLFDGNNRTGAAGGSGIYTDVATNGLTIDDNEFKNHTNNSAVVFGASASNTHQNLSFTKNYIHDNNIDNSMVYSVAVNGGTFSQNTITQPGTTALKFAGANSAIMVINNFLDNNGVGVRIADDGFGFGGNTGIEIHNNSLSNNSNKAIDNQEAPTINATCNWYGTTNVDAQAASLFGGSVTYSPYLNSGTDNEGGTPGFQPVPGSCASMLSLAFTASPNMLLTSGTTTLSAVVSGGNTPYSYVFTGPGTINQSSGSNTATVSNIPAGVQTFTVVASDATTPTAQTISGTVSVTVTQENTPPTVANPVPPQSATVGVAYTLSLANVFTDAETPSSLTLTVSSLPAGLNFTPPSTISGTPSMSGVTSVTVTATDPGSLTASNTFTITVSPAPVVITPLSLTFTASPDMLLTSGTTTLSATVSGGTTPYSYAFSGPGTINQSSGSNTATVSNLPAGVQTFTVVASDATSPTAQTISGTVSVTVTEANTAPVATANANQTATVGVPFSYTVNAFTDAETPNSLTYTASINPTNGLSFDANNRVISGTPSMSGVSSVTVTATDPGSLSASTSFTITVSPAGTPPPTGTFSITGVTTVSCEAISAGLRRVTFNPRYAGLNGTPVSFSVVNEMAPTTNPGPYTLNLYTDNPVITLEATQSGATNQFAYNWLAACSSSTANTPPTVANPVPPQSATVGIGYTLSLANVFTDAETPNSLVLSVTGLPAGLNFVAPSTISGTPSMSGVSTVTVTATDPGSMSASTSFTITVNPAAGTPPPPTGTFSITGVTTVSCTTLSAGLRQVTFNPRYAGLNGSPVSFSVVNEMAPTTNPGPYTLNLYTDNPVITLNAVQSGVSNSFAYNWLAACGGSNPPANTPPTVANPVPPQSATVGVGYTLSLANVFTDAETPNQLTLAVSGLPAGLVFTAPSTISGTPSMSGVSTVTVTATDPGSMSASTSFTITVNPAAGTPPPTGTFSITGVTTVNCQVISSGQRQVTFNPRYAGLDGTPVSFSVVNEMLPTTNPGPYTLNLYTDNSVITLSAVQSGVSSTFTYNWLAACTPSAPSARVSGEPVSGLHIQVLGNPVSHLIEVLVTGAAGNSLNLVLTDEQGQRVNQFATEQALPVQKVRFEVGHLPAGILLLRASTPTETKTIRVLKSN